MKTNLMQLLRLVLMVLAVAGVIYAIEFMERGIAVWFWVALLGIGFVGLLYTFRLTQRCVARENRERQRLEKAQPPFETLTGAVTGGCRSFCRFRVRDPAGIVFRGPQVPCGSFVRDRSSGRLDVDPGSERRSESSVLSDQPPACAGRRTILSGGRRMFSSESRRAFRFRNKGSCLFRRPIVRVRPNCPTWC